MNGVDQVRCFGAGLGSDRSACVEEKRERESMLGPETIRQDKEQGRYLAQALRVPPFSGLEDLFWSGGELVSL